MKELRKRLYKLWRRRGKDFEARECLKHFEHNVCGYVFSSQLWLSIPYARTEVCLQFFQTALLKIEMLDKKGQKKFATGSEVIPNYWYISSVQTAWYATLSSLIKLATATFMSHSKTCINTYANR
jgi:hypothetical protein